MENDSIGGFLDALASDAPAPGGGAVAGLEVAMAAALVEMVCNLTIGKPAYAEHDEIVREIRDGAAPIRIEALALAAEDAEAFASVIAAYRLPKSTDAETEKRAEQIQVALAAAADVPRRTALAAIATLDLAERIVPIGNVNVISDAAAAAGAARGALQTALLNIDANRASIKDAALLGELAAVAGEIDRSLARADAIVASVRARMAG